MKQTRILFLMAAVVGIMVLGLAAFGAGAADHLEAPLVRADGRLDINDVYAFKDGDYTALVMTVNPVAGVLSPTYLAENPVSYNFMIDNDGDAVEDLVLQLTAARTRNNGKQRVTLTKWDVDSWTSTRLVQGMSERRLTGKASTKLYVGLRDDPFFFDLQAFRDTLGGGSRAFCDSGTTDFFAGLNVSAIVVRVRTNMLTDGSPNIGVWGETQTDGTVNDRMGRPAIATVFIGADDRDAYNATEPVDDYATWGADVSGVLMALGGYDAPTADSIAAILLPDILTIDTSSSDGFLNGRGLADDVIDAELGIVTNGGIPTDCIDANDNPFSMDFPYLAMPN